MRSATTDECNNDVPVFVLDRHLRTNLFLGSASWTSA